MTKRLLGVFLLFTISACSFAPKQVQQGNDQQFQLLTSQFIEKTMEDTAMTGLSIAVVDGDNLVWSEGFGLAQTRTMLKATPTTRYRAGSITKLFTAMSIMQLREKGLIDIDEPYQDYVESFAFNSRFGPISAITARNMMHHHSGLPSDYLPGMFETTPSRKKPLSALMADEYQTYPVNTVFSYSNTAYVLLGEAITARSNIAYSDYVAQSLLMPLAMQDSNIETHIQGGEVTGAYIAGNEVYAVPLQDVAAGGLTTTVTDMANFIKMLNNQGNYQGNQVLKPSSLAAMYEIQNHDVALDLDHKVGLGWHYSQDVLQGEKVIGHDGRTVAHSSIFLYAPEQKLGVIVLSNDGGNTNGVAQIAEQALRYAYQAKYGQHTLHSEPKLESKELKEQPDLSGYFTTVAGFTKIESQGEDYIASTGSESFNLNKRQDKGYDLGVDMLGFIPVDLEVKVFLTQVSGYQALIAEHQGSRFIAGSKVEPYTIPKAWEQRVGKYRLANQPEPDLFKIKGLTLLEQDGFLVIKLQDANDAVSEYVLSLLDDKQVVVEGLGRNLGLTVTAGNDAIPTLHYAGLIFIKTEDD